MRASCADCGLSTTADVGYCRRCGGVRVISRALGPADMAHRSWPASPLIVSRIPGLDSVYLKYEGGHASGSFKDRIMRITVGQAMRAGARGAVVPSSGNAAVAAAAACAAAGLPLIAVVPAPTSEERIVPMLARGVSVLKAGAEPSEAYRYADLLVEHLDLFPLYSTFASPWAEWACRAVGVEACRQLDRAPATVVAPISAGPVLVGAGRGVEQVGGDLPRLVAVQAEGCCPIAKAFTDGRDRVEPWTADVNTAAVAIADRLHGYPQDGTYTLRLLRESGGRADVVSDAEMQEARDALLRHDGLDVEFSATAGVALLRRRRHAFPAPVVCVLTASGFKHTYRGDIRRPPASTEQAQLADRAASLIVGAGGSAVLV